MKDRIRFLDSLKLEAEEILVSRYHLWVCWDKFRGQTFAKLYRNKNEIQTKVMSSVQRG